MSRTTSSGRTAGAAVAGASRSSTLASPRSGKAEIDEQQRLLLDSALQLPLGVYEADRAAQLSGIPKSTLYEWRRSRIYLPDFNRASPTAWSYRDLVFLRLLAWLRQGGMSRHTAARQVAQLKREVASGHQVRRVRATKTELFVEPERFSRTTGEQLLPFESLLDYVSRVFDLESPIEELARRGHRRERLWAPSLVMPSAHTSISPWVMAGEPCVVRSRIPTSAIWALRAERGLDHAAIVALYPGLSVTAAKDAEHLERRLRGQEAPEPSAA